MNIDVCNIDHKYKAEKKSDRKCAPYLEFKDESCFPLNILILFAQAYNKSRQSNDIEEIELNDEWNKCESQYKKYLLGKLHDRFKKQNLNGQYKWLKSSIIKNIDRDEFVKHMRPYIDAYKLKKDRKKHLELDEYIFRPKGPGKQGTYTWLNTVNINKVMKQYELKHSEFKFLEAVPIDFASLSYCYGYKEDQLMALYGDGIRKIGSVFNLDASYQSGSHWVSLYADFDKKQICFSDSSGSPPNANIMAYIKIIKDVIIKINNTGDHTGGGNNEVTININKTRHQYGGSECGVYSINFILNLLGGVPFEKLSYNRLADETVNKCREVYFVDQNASDSSSNASAYASTKKKH